MPGAARAEAPNSFGPHLLAGIAILLAQSKNYRDGSLDFHWLAVQICRAIAPLPHRIQGGLHEPWRATCDLNRRDASFSTDDRMQ